MQTLQRNIDRKKVLSWGSRETKLCWCINIFTHMLTLPLTSIISFSSFNSLSNWSHCFWLQQSPVIWPQQLQTKVKWETLHSVQPGEYCTRLERQSGHNRERKTEEQITWCRGEQQKEDGVIQTADEKTATTNSTALPPNYRTNLQSFNKLPAFPFTFHLKQFKLSTSHWRHRRSAYGLHPPQLLQDLCISLSKHWIYTAISCLF